MTPRTPTNETTGTTPADRTTQAAPAPAPPGTTRADAAAPATTWSATMNPSAWEEQPGFGDGAPTPRVAHVVATFGYEGDLAGTGECRYAMYYGADGTCRTVGHEVVTGSIGGREGSFALRHEGTHTEAAGLQLGLAVVEGSATGDLAGLAGEGTLAAAPGEHACRWRLRATFDR